MRREEFLDQVARLGIRPDAYDLNGLGNETYSLSCDGIGYSVYYAERGFRREAESFTDEGTALDRLLQRLIKDPTTRIP